MFQQINSNGERQQWPDTAEEDTARTHTATAEIVAAIAAQHVRRWKNPILWTLISCVALRVSLLFSLIFVYSLFLFHSLPFNSFICLSFSFVLERDRIRTCDHIHVLLSFSGFSTFFSRNVLRCVCVCSISSRLSIQSILQYFLSATKFLKYSPRERENRAIAKNVFIFIYPHHHIGSKIVYIVF